MSTKPTSPLPPREKSAKSTMLPAWNRATVNLSRAATGSAAANRPGGVELEQRSETRSLRSPTAKASVSPKPVSTPKASVRLLRLTKTSLRPD
ncbi:MAG: hypothetical protein QXU97_04425 [Fervidicoccaceae archaeon]